MSVKTFRERVELKVQDDADILSKAQVEKVIVDALSTFSKDCPIIQATSVSGDDGFDYDLPAGWVNGFSIVKAIEYPAGDQIPIYIEPEDHIIYDNATTKKLRFLVYQPSSSESFIVSYTIPYTEASIDDIPATHADAFAELAASIYCDTLSNHYSQYTDSSIDADSVDYGGKATDWAARAKHHKRLYDDHLGKSGGVKPASGTIDWDNRPSWPDRDYLLHPRKSR